MPERLLHLYLRTSSDRRITLTIVDPRDGPTQGMLYRSTEVATLLNESIVAPSSKPRRQLVQGASR